MIRHSLVNRENWEQLAVIDDAKRLSYRDLAQRAIAVKRQLPQSQRQNIALFLPNSADYIAALFGTLMAGATAFPLNTRLTIHEITPLLRLASVRTVIATEAHRPLFEQITQTVPVQVLYMDDLQTCECDQCLVTARTDVDTHAPMILLTTSGTTGNTKIVQLSEKNVASSTLAYIGKMDFAKFAKDALRLTLGTPFCSVYGLMVLTACVIQSIPIVVLNEGFTLETLYKAAQRHRITHFEGGVSVGLQMEQLAGRPNPYDISSFRYFGLAGSNISAGTLRRLMAAYPGVEFWTGYGMTEAGPLIAKPDKQVNPEKLDSVGTKTDQETVLVYADGALTDAPNTRGEIVVKGPNVMLGYYKNEAETRKILKDGYLYTGDIGYIDEDGYLYICGRRKNIILVRGFTVHAEEVEACLLNSGLVKDCIVYGKADATGNEAVCADIIPTAPEVRAENIRAYCREHLADYKRPQTIQMIDTIKKTATGKTERA